MFRKIQISIFHVQLNHPNETNQLKMMPRKKTRILYQNSNGGCLRVSIIGDFFLLLTSLYFYIEQTFQLKEHLLFKVT